MSVITDALDKLKIDILAIKSGNIDYDMTHLSDLNDSKAPFANPALLPTTITADPSRYVSPINSPYSDNVLQAVWNIADLARNIVDAEGSYWSLLLNGPFLKTCFKYLGEKTYVPQIIDNKTYRAGLALREFLSVALNDQDASKLLEPVTYRLLPMQQVLNDRIDRYEAHLNSKKMAETNRFLIQMEERYTLWKDQITPFRGLIPKDTDQVIVKGYDPMRSELHSDVAQLAAIVDLIADRKIQIENLRRQIDQFKAFNEQWKNDNEPVFPETVICSDYIKLLVDQNAKPDDIIDAWRELLTTNIELTHVHIKRSLQTTYRHGTRDCEEANRIVHILEGQIEALEQHHTAILALGTYEGHLNATLSEYSPLLIPDYISIDSGSFAYQMDLSTAENQMGRLESDRQSYATLKEQLQAFAQQLKEKETTMLAQHMTFIDDNPLPAEAKDYKKVFKQTQEKAREQLLTKIEEIRELHRNIEQLLAKASKEHEAINIAINKQSREGRSALLGDAQARIKSTHTKAQESAVLLQHERALYEAMPKANEQLLATIEEKIQARRVFLATANSKLNEFLRNIPIDSLYIPVDAVPKVELKSYLECNQAVAELIDELYDKEQAATKNYGVNLTYAFDLFNRHVNPLGLTEQEDISTLLEHINEKLALINTEMAIQFSSTDPHHGPAQNPTTDNLYSLRDQNHQALQPRKTRTKQKNVLSKLGMQALLDGIDSSQADVNFAITQLEFHLVDIQPQQQRLSRLLAEIEEMEPDQAFVRFDEQKEGITQIANWFELTTQQQLPLPHEWVSRNELKWQELEAFQTGMLIPLSAEAVERKALLLKEQEELKQRKSTTDTQYEALRQLNINLIAKKQQLDQIRVEQERLAEERLKQERLDQATRSVPPITIVPTTGLSNASMPQLSQLSHTFFKPYQGQQRQAAIFIEYLHERAITFWFRDLCSQFVAMVFGCFGYKTEATSRKEYIAELNADVAAYNNQPGPLTYDALSTLIDSGLKNFSPRAQKGPDYQKSLHCKLMGFKQELGTLLATAPVQETALAAAK